jgi:hypothetical protein
VLPPIKRILEGAGIRLLEAGPVRDQDEIACCLQFESGDIRFEPFGDVIGKQPDVNMASPLSDPRDRGERPQVGCELAFQFPGKTRIIGIHDRGEPLPEFACRHSAGPQRRFEVVGEDLFEFAGGAPRSESEALPPFMLEHLLKEHAADVEQQEPV